MFYGSMGVKVGYMQYFPATGDSREMLGNVRKCQEGVGECREMLAAPVEGDFY